MNKKTFEEWLAGIIRERGVNLSEMARKIEMPYQLLYDSLFNKNKKRELRSSEVISVCAFLGVNPMEFADKKEGE